MRLVRNSVPCFVFVALSGLRRLQNEACFSFDVSLDEVEILPSLEDYLTDCGRTNLMQVEQFLEYLGGIEDQARNPNTPVHTRKVGIQAIYRDKVSVICWQNPQVFKHRLDRESKMRAEKEAERAKATKEEVEYISTYSVPSTPSTRYVVWEILRECVESIPSLWSSRCQTFAPMQVSLEPSGAEQMGGSLAFGGLVWLQRSSELHSVLGLEFKICYVHISCEQLLKSCVKPLSIQYFSHFCAGKIWKDPATAPSWHQRRRHPTQVPGMHSSWPSSQKRSWTL